MTQNDVVIPFAVDSLTIRRLGGEVIPALNRNHIFAGFTFAPSWDDLSKVAVFSKDNISTEHVSIIDDLCLIPEQFMIDSGFVYVSVYAGDLRTVNSARIRVVKSGFRELDSFGLYVMSPDSSIPNIGYDTSFWFEAEGEKKRIYGEAGDLDSEALDRIAALESGLAATQAEATAKWVLLNTVDNRSRSNTDRIITLENTITALQKKLEAIE